MFLYGGWGGGSMFLMLKNDEELPAAHVNLMYKRLKFLICVHQCSIVNAHFNVIEIKDT